MSDFEDEEGVDEPVLEDENEEEEQEEDVEDVCGNQLKDISSINSLTHLLTLKCDRNQLHSAKLDELPYLQIASFANNKIMDTEGISHPLLEHLNLSYNEIVEVAGLDAVKLNRLAILELRGNKLMNTNGLNITNLKELYLGANTIKAIEGFDRFRTSHKTAS
ncbi:hypothetical protein QZH41_001742 [Actinostola sp. cb2023]|nr:hypothetical protein QZH41_001742 [Actinostola sp. cb2023]